MVLQAISQSSIGRAVSVCTRCRIRGENTGVWISKRCIGMKYLAKVAAAEDEWQQKASRIRAKKEKDMLTILEERGLVNQAIGDTNILRERLISRRVGIYVGVDPTASSLHMGNLVPLMALFWMYLEGYHTVSLLGGATAKIGDPTDRLSSRKKEKPAVRAANMTCMHLQLKRLWLNVEALGRKYGFKRTWANHRELTNNSMWWNKTTMLEVLQTLGPGMRLGTMLARETVKQKMHKGDGMSYAEFSYPILQAWDWWYMFHSKGIQFQIGGSDQFGNILAGIDAIKYILATHPDPEFLSKAKHVGEPMGFTVPLLTTASGEKFGKSAGNAIWLDSDLMSSFDLYGHLLRTADTDVEMYLKMFTFIPLQQIKSLFKEHMMDPPKRLAQHKLAQEFVELVHGTENATEAKEQHRLLFSKGSSPIHLATSASTSNSTEASDLNTITTANNRPKINLKLPESLVFQRMFGKVVYAAGFAQSLSESRRLLNASSIYIGTMPDRSFDLDCGHLTWSKVESNSEAPFLRKYLSNGEIIILRKGKHNVRIIQIVTDEEFVKAGLEYPGMTREWKDSVLEAIEAKKMGIEKEKKYVKEVGIVEDLLLEEKELTRPAE